MQNLDYDTLSHIATKFHTSTLQVVYKFHKEFFNNREVLATISNYRGYKVSAESFIDYYMLVEYDESGSIKELSLYNMFIFLAKYSVKQSVELPRQWYKTLYYFNSPFVKYLVASDGIFHRMRSFNPYIAYEYIKQGKSVPEYIGYEELEIATFLRAIEVGDDLSEERTTQLLGDSISVHVYPDDSTYISLAEYMSYLIGYNNRLDLEKKFSSKLSPSYLRQGFLEANLLLDARRIEVDADNWYVRFITVENFNLDTYECCKDLKVGLMAFVSLLPIGDILKQLLVKNSGILLQAIEDYVGQDRLEGILLIMELYPNIVELIKFLIRREGNVAGRIEAWLNMYEIVGDVY